MDVHSGGPLCWVKWDKNKNRVNEVTLGIYILLPVLYNDGRLSRENMTAILIQVKNDAVFGYNVNQLLFDAMNPFDIEVFSDMAKTTPVIRLVFALAATRSPSHIGKPLPKLKPAIQVIPESD